MAIGGNNRAACGPTGYLAVEYWDGARRRLAVGYAGENGIKPGVWYRADSAGTLVEVGPVEQSAETHTGQNAQEA